MNLQLKQERAALIQRYLDAETSVDEERMLAAYYREHPAEGDERPVAAALSALSGAAPVTDGTAAERDAAEFGRILRRRRCRALSGLAAAGAALALLLLLPVLHPKSEQASDGDGIPGLSAEALIHQISSIAELELVGADRIECRPCGDAFLLTAIFPDGSETSYLLTPLETDGPLNMLTLSEK